MDNEFTADAMDINTKIGLLKAAAAATNPLPHHKLRDLDLIIEEVSQKITQFQNTISSHYDKVLRTIRRLQVPETDVELFKSVAAFLQVEKTVKKSKVYKVLTAGILNQQTSKWRPPHSKRFNRLDRRQKPGTGTTD